jgi:hypothetical protein
MTTCPSIDVLWQLLDEQLAPPGYFLVLDVVDGINLESRVKSGAISLGEVPALVATIAEAVQHAHEHGVIHRDLNDRYGSPLGTEAAIDRFYRLLAGHPYLSHRGLYEMVTHELSIAALEQRTPSDEGFFGDHLRRMLVLLTQDGELCGAVRAVLGGGPSPGPPPVRCDAGLRGDGSGGGTQQRLGRRKPVLRPRGQDERRRSPRHDGVGYDRLQPRGR